MARSKYMFLESVKCWWNGFKGSTSLRKENSSGCVDIICAEYWTVQNKEKFSTCAKSSSVTKSATAIFLSFSKVGVISGMKQNLTKIFHRMKAFLCLLLQMFIATTKCMEEGHCSIPTRLYQHLLWFHELVYIGKVFIFRILSTTSQHLPTDQKL